jgi:hypothetical protein
MTQEERKERLQDILKQHRVSIEELEKEVAMEIGYRIAVYPGLIQNGKMKKAEAEIRQRNMNAPINPSAV